MERTRNVNVRHTELTAPTSFKCLKSALGCANAGASATKPEQWNEPCTGTLETHNWQHLPGKRTWLGQEWGQRNKKPNECTVYQVKIPPNDISHRFDRNGVQRRSGCALGSNRFHVLHEVFASKRGHYARIEETAPVGQMPRPM